LQYFRLWLSCRKYQHMKHFSTILNIFLLLAVGFLYYLHFSGMRRFKADGTGKDGVKGHFYSKGPVIAFVNVDSLNNNVTFIKQKQAEMDAGQKNIDAIYQGQLKKLLAERDKFQKNMSTATPQQVEDFQERLQQADHDIEDEKQQQTQLLAQKGAKEAEDIQAKLKDYIKEYNQDKKYTYILETGAEYGGLMLYKDSTLDITPDIVKGLNDKLKRPDNDNQ
jgi:outer membrane protein